MFLFRLLPVYTEWYCFSNFPNLEKHDWHTGCKIYLKTGGVHVNRRLIKKQYRTLKLTADYQPLFGNMSPRSYPVEERSLDRRERRKSNLCETALHKVLGRTFRLPYSCTSFKFSSKRSIFWGSFYKCKKKSGKYFFRRTHRLKFDDSVFHSAEQRLLLFGCCL